MGLAAISRQATWAGCALLWCLPGFGCSSQPPRQPPSPSVAPATQPTASLALDAARIHPMYRQLLAVDLPTVSRVAVAQGLDIQLARQRVEASRGRYESSVEAVFPV